MFYPRQSSSFALMIWVVFAVTSVLALTGCGSSTDELVRSDDAGQPAEAARAQGKTSASIGNPRHILSLTNKGVAQTHVAFETYEQLRDYSDMAALVRVEKVEVSEPFEPPYLRSGTLDVTATVLQVLGGRLSTEVGSSVTFVLPMDANPSQLERFRPNLKELKGLQYVVFAHKAVWGDRPDTFEPILYGAPPAVLSVWPETGRITAIQPTGFLAEDAIASGEELTGTSSPQSVEWQPSYDGPMPIGLTADELGRFAAAPGSPEVDPPVGWKNLEQYLAPA